MGGKTWCSMRLVNQGGNLIVCICIKTTALCISVSLFMALVVICKQNQQHSVEQILDGRLGLHAVVQAGRLLSCCRSGPSEHGYPSAGSRALNLALKYNLLGPSVPSHNASCTKSPLLEDFPAGKWGTSGLSCEKQLGHGCTGTVHGLFQPRMFTFNLDVESKRKKESVKIIVWTW